jgi:hypothetical protein
MKADAEAVRDTWRVYVGNATPAGLPAWGSDTAIFFEEPPPGPRRAFEERHRGLVDDAITSVRWLDARIVEHEPLGERSVLETRNGTRIHVRAHELNHSLAIGGDVFLVMQKNAVIAMRCTGDGLRLAAILRAESAS